MDTRAGAYYGPLLRSVHKNHVRLKACQEEPEVRAPFNGLKSDARVVSARLFFLKGVKGDKSVGGSGYEV